MSSRRLFSHSIRRLGRYKLRTAFMMLGAFIGVTALTLVVSIGEGAERRILKTLRQLFGASTVAVYGRGNQHVGPRPGAARLTIDDLEAVAREVPGIDAWDPQQTVSASVRYGDATARVRIYGHSERFERVWGRGVSRGEYFDEPAVRSLARVALIGATVADALFGDQDPIGAEILVGAVPFRVIGVLEAYGTDLHGMDRDNEIVAPISTVMRRIMNVDTIAGARVMTAASSTNAAVAEAVARVLRTRHGIGPDQPDDFTILTPAEVQRRLGMLQRTFVVYLPLVSGVALIVGGIVAATLMLASVNERTAEIGLRRAVGARPQDIRLQFLLEAAVTMLAGGIAGVVVGYAGAQYAANMIKLGDVFSWKATLVGLAVSTATGLLAGLVPAIRAARLPPADALR